MWTFLAPALFAVLLWWASTGAILYLVGLAERAPRALLAGAAIVFALALAALHLTAADESATGAYLAFTAAIAIWGVQELAFLAGWITGPWRQACPKGIGGWSRAGHALAAIIHHEVALLVTGAAVAAATHGGPNRTGLLTFAVLFVMRVSAKLNVFLGVPNRSEAFLPKHLSYLATFFAERSMNLLFPLSITAITLLLGALVWEASAATGAAAIALTLVATLVGLALLEHWFMVLPLPAESLWQWGLKHREDASRPAARPDAGARRLAFERPITVTPLERGQEP